jgi:hypothetical protein
MKYVSLGLLCLFAFLGGVVPVSYAQGDAAISIVPHMEDGNEFFEVVGTGFPAGEKVRVGAVNRRTDQGVTLTAVASATGGFGGVFVGKDADGRYYVVAPGTWRVRAKSGEVVAKTTFESRQRVPEGMWGSDKAALRLTASTAEIILPCALGRSLVPLFVDADGHFSARAVLADQRGPVQGPDRVAQLDGTLQGNTITFTVTVLATDTTEEQVYGPFTVVFNRQPTFERCA